MELINYGIRILPVLILFAHHVIAQICYGYEPLNKASGIIDVASYYSNANCAWELSPPSSSYTYVQITFLSFDTWPDADYVDVYNGPSTSSPRILHWSGWDLPSPSTYYSTQPSMTITFTSDDSISGSGFSISYKWLTGTPPPCSGTIEVPSDENPLELYYNTLTSFECIYLIQSNKYTSPNDDYTVEATLVSFSDPSYGLTVEVYAVSPQDTIQWYDYAMATWTAYSLDYQTHSESFVLEVPGLQVKVISTVNSTQPSSVSMRYKFSKDDYGINTHLAIILGSVFGSLFVAMIFFGTMFALRRARMGGLSGGAFWGFMFARSMRNDAAIPILSTPQTTTTTVVHTTTSHTSPNQGYPLQSYPPPMNPEYMQSQASNNPYPYYGST